MSKRLEKRIERLKEKIKELGEVYPGSMKPQYNICGTPGCKCKDKKDPQRHGPYYNLSFTYKGRSRTKFIREELVNDFKKYTLNYKKLKEYFEELIGLNIELIEEKTKR